MGLDDPSAYDESLLNSTVVRNDLHEQLDRTWETLTSDERTTITASAFLGRLHTLGDGRPLPHDLEPTAINDYVGDYLAEHRHDND